MFLSNQINAILTNHPDIRLGILFGSVARGKARPESDLDIAVEGKLPLTVDEKVELIGELAALSGRAVDLVDLRTAGSLILKEAITTGKLIYCKDRPAYAELIKRMLFHQADFQPYRDRILAERRKQWIND